MSLELLTRFQDDLTASYLDECQQMLAKYFPNAVEDAQTLEYLRESWQVHTGNTHIEANYNDVEEWQDQEDYLRTKSKALFNELLERLQTKGVL